MKTGYSGNGIINQGISGTKPHLRPSSKVFFMMKGVGPSKYEIHNCDLVRITFSLQDPLPYRYMGKGSGTLATFS